MAGRLRRVVPPFALFAGLLFFGLGLLYLAAESHEEGELALAPSVLAVTGGSGLVVYPVEYHNEDTERIDVAYTFPGGSGEAYFVGCADVARLREGAPPQAPFLAFTGLADATFHVDHQVVADWRPFYVEDGGFRHYCAPALAFRWPAQGDDPSVGRPEVRAVHRSADLDGESFVALAILMGGGALAALLGGLAWARGRDHATPAGEGGSTVEMLRAGLDQMGAQLERTRRHLLLGGVLGVFLWYPALVPWVWQTAERASESAFVPWAVAGLTILFLGVLTLLWAREFHRLDRELQAWRERMRALREREEGLLATLEGG